MNALYKGGNRKDASGNVSVTYSV